MTLTTKEWIVPPRPKPGRKPATDTPPTKRKAQNRAAQRAFRERRAARVGELEEQLKEIEDQNEQEQEDLRLEVTELRQVLAQRESELTTWVNKCRTLEVELVNANASLAKQSKRVSIMANSEAQVSEPIGCGNCTLESRCQCIDDVVKDMDTTAENAAFSTQTDSKQDGSNKRIKLEPSETNIMEVDFTAAFTKGSQVPRSDHTSAGVADPCGFCSDGTSCICAEMAAEQERQNITRPNSPVNGGRQAQRQISQFTPPPSEGDVGASAPGRSRCAGGPGTCAQCVADPNSTLFCKSLAASRGSSNCCGGTGPNGNCCQSSVVLPPRTTRSRAMADPNLRLPRPPTRSPLTLSCADAYTALSRHSAYERATGDMASWMPKLHANPTSVEGRPAMEIDAANVMAVLKDFDRRFGSSK